MKTSHVAGAVLLAALAGAAFALDGPPERDLESWRRDIVVFARLPEAEKLIADEGLQKRLRAEDEKVFQTVFDEALAQADLRRLLAKKPMAGDLRMRLLARSGCRLCDDPSGIRDWIARNGIAVDAAMLSKALYDWPTLSLERNTCLLVSGRREEPWRELKLRQRLTVLRDCAERDLVDAHAPFPRDREAYAKLFGAAKRCAEVMFYGELYEIGTRLNQAERLLMAQERAAESAKLGDDKARKALETALSSADPAAAAAALNAFYDQAGTRDGESSMPGVGRSDAAGEGRYRVLGESLASSLLEAIQGTWAGDELTAFYKKEPLRVEIRGTARAWAQYNPADNVITFSRAAVDQLLADQGLSPEDAVKDGAALHRVAVALSSVFVHEATHQEMHAWERDHGVGLYPAVDGEIEAMENEAVFLIEKFKRDKDFARDYRRAAKKGTIAEDSMKMAMHFRDAPEGFRDVVRNKMYAYRSGNEGVAADDHQFYRGYAESYEAALRHRAGLPEAERAAFEAMTRAAVLDKPAFWPNPDDAKDLSSPALRELAARARAKAGMTEAQYGQYRRRAAAAAVRADERRELLRGFFVPPRPRAPEPPSPGGPS